MGFGLVRAVARILAASAPLLAAIGEPALAGPNANAKILIHLLAPIAKGPCSSAAATPPCSSVVTAGDLYPATYFAYVLVTDADSAAGVAGVQFGIDYDGAAQSGVDIYDWTNCATLEFAEPGWPNAGTGNLVTWDTTSRCQRSEPEGLGTGVKAVVGYFYCAAYSADTLRITVRDVDSVAAVASCDAAPDTLESPEQFSAPYPLGFAVFSADGATEGYNPCGLVGGENFRTSDPPDSEDQQAGFSSQYDPLNPPISLPHEFTLPDGHFYVIHGTIFEPGSHIVFDFSAGTQCLTANGQLVLDYTPAEPGHDGSEEGRWTSAFVDAYLSTKSTLPSRERAALALAILDETGTDRLRPPEVTSEGVRVWFRDRDTPVLILYPLPAPSTAHRQEISAKDAAGLVRFLAKQPADGAFVWVAGEEHIEYYWGDKAERARQFITGIATGTLTPPLAAGEAEVLHLTDKDLQRILQANRGGGE